MGESQLEKKNSKKNSSEKETSEKNASDKKEDSILEINENTLKDSEENSEENSENEIPVPKDSLVKFRTCECGALLDESETICWSCGKKYASSEKSEISGEEVNKESSEKSEIPEKEVNNEYYESAIKDSGYAKFVKCDKCGALIDVYDSITICWSCNNQIDTSSLFKQISNKNADSSSMEQHDKNPIQSVQSTKKKKNKLVKYVLHCTKCNSWFVSNNYYPEMTCGSCGTKKSLFVSYTCNNCKKFFDLNKLTKKDCPYCKKPLQLTAEESLF